MVTRSWRVLLLLHRQIHLLNHPLNSHLNQSMNQSMNLFMNVSDGLTVESIAGLTASFLFVREEKPHTRDQ